MPAHVEHHDLEDRARLVCPRDGETMRRFSVGGVKIDRCSVCAGIWLDLGERDGLLDRRGRSLDELRTLDRGVGAPFAGGERARRRCPRDTSPLTAVRDPHQPHVEYDLCTHCGGMFFDSGELADLSRFTLAERLKWILRT